MCGFCIRPAQPWKMHPKPLRLWRAPCSLLQVAAQCAQTPRHGGCPVIKLIIWQLPGLVSLLGDIEHHRLEDLLLEAHVAVKLLHGVEEALIPLQHVRAALLFWVFCILQPPHLRNKRLDPLAQAVLLASVAPAAVRRAVRRAHHPEGGPGGPISPDSEANKWLRHRGLSVSKKCWL